MKKITLAVLLIAGLSSSAQTIVSTTPQNKKVVLEGFVKQDTISVKMLRHFAEDAGKPKSEIKKIIKPEFKLSFIANGVIIN